MPASRTPASARAPGPAGTLDEAALCQTLADHHGGPARMVIGIALRQHLDGLVLTPAELIHNSRHLKALQAKTTLMEATLAKVATVQARLPGQDAKARRRALDNAVCETSAKGRTAGDGYRALNNARWISSLVLPGVSWAGSRAKGAPADSPVTATSSARGSWKRISLTSWLLVTVVLHSVLIHNVQNFFRVVQIRLRPSASTPDGLEPTVGWNPSRGLPRQDDRPHGPAIRTSRPVRGHC